MRKLQKEKLKLPRFFNSWDSKPYVFMNEEIEARHEMLTMSPRPAVVLTDVKEKLREFYDITTLDVMPRSKYDPSMLYAPCARYERGGDSSRVNWSAYKAAVKRARDLFVLKHKTQPLSLSEVKFEGNKNSGLPYLCRKDQVYEQSLERAESCIQGACPPPVVMFHRGKNTEEARPVFGFPFEWHLVEGRFFYPLQEQLLKAKTPYYVGKSSVETAGMINELTFSPYVLEMDYSGFDGSLSGLLIGSSFRILKDNMMLSNADSALFDRVAAYFTTSPIVAPDGRVYVGKRHGVPSGSMFTQLIDTICNAIIIEYICIRLNYEKHKYVCVGDDSLTAFSSKPDVQEMAQVAEEVGIRVSTDKTLVHDTDTEFRVHFLGHHWNEGVPTRPVSESLERLLAPERLTRELNSKATQEQRIQAIRQRIRAYQEDNASSEAWLVLNRLEREFVWPPLSDGAKKVWPLHHSRHQNLPITETGFDRYTGNRKEVRVESGSRRFMRVINNLV